jgi:HEAT repeat protein
MDAHNGQHSIPELIAALNSGHWRERQEAHDQLAALGPAAEPALVEAVHSPEDQVRWEALKILSGLADPSLAPVFVATLRTDRNEGNRWVATHALTHLGHVAIRPLLQELVQHSDSAFLRTGAHHVLRALRKLGYAELLDPVLEALEHFDPMVRVPLAAHRALDIMDGRRENEY